MAYTRINGRNSVADFLINGKSWKCILSTFLIDVTTDQIPSATFCTEPNEDFEAGTTTILTTIGGNLNRGTGGSGEPSDEELTLVPPPQKVPIIAQFDVNCTIGFTANFRRATLNRVANQPSIITGEAFSTGVIAVAWTGPV